MDRDTAAYQTQRMLWEFCKSRVWLDFLKPLLEKKAQPNPLTLQHLDDVFKLCRQQGASQFANYVLQEVEAKARQFDHRQKSYQNAQTSQH